MKDAPVKFETTKEYFAALPAAQKKILTAFRNIIKEVAPKAEEVISYNMPAFKLNGMLVWYAVYKEHIGLYPRPNAIAFFKDELADYKTSKGAIQFPITQKIPVSLVKKIIKFRIEENAAAKKIITRKKK